MHVLTRIVPAVVFALSLIGAAAPVRADMPCGAPAEVLKTLHDTYAEVPAFTGALANVDRPVTLTVSPAGTWTLLFAVNGVLCVGPSGDHWQAIAATGGQALKPVPNSLPAAPALLGHGLILIQALEGLRD